MSYNEARKALNNNKGGRHEKDIIKKDMGFIATSEAYEEIALRKELKKQIKKKEIKSTLAKTLREKHIQYKVPKDVKIEKDSYKLDSDVFEDDINCTYFKTTSAHFFITKESYERISERLLKNYSHERFQVKINRRTYILDRYELSSHEYMEQALSAHLTSETIHYTHFKGKIKIKGIIE